MEISNKGARYGGRSGSRVSGGHLQAMVTEQRHSDSGTPAILLLIEGNSKPGAEKVVVYVPGFYENKKPWTRKAFHMVRMALEVTGKEALDGGPKKVQASRVSEGDRTITVTVGHITAFSELREALHAVPVIHSNKNSLPSQLSQVESHNSRKPCTNEGVTDLEEDLFPIQLPMANLFDIQINEIDADLNQFNELPSMKGNTTNALNEYFDLA